MATTGGFQAINSPGQLSYRMEQAKIAKLYETFRHVHKFDKSLDEAVEHVLE